MKLVLIALLIVSGIALADPQSMPISVLGNGATLAQNASGTRLQATVGQALAKRAVNVTSTLGGGFWPVMRATLFAPVDNSKQTLPTRIEFHAAYPNPFNPSTSLSFSLPRASVVRLTLFDITGRNIATLANGKLSAGEHRLIWNANRFASGTYFARLQAAEYSHTQRLFLLK